MAKTTTIRASVHAPSGLVEALINPNPAPSNGGPPIMDGMELAQAEESQREKAAQLAKMATPFHVAVVTSVANTDPKVVVDSRICDLYNFQSRKWLTNHQYWAMHQGHTVEIHPATDDEVTAYTSKQAQLLSRRYSH